MEFSNLKLVATTLLALSLATMGSAQTPGDIFQPATPAANQMNLNGDAWATISAVQFTSNEKAEFELPYFSVPGLALEPDGDQTLGADCGVADIVDNPATLNEYAYLRYDDAGTIGVDADDLFLCRIRCAF